MNEHNTIIRAIASFFAPYAFRTKYLEPNDLHIEPIVIIAPRLWLADFLYCLAAFFIIGFEIYIILFLILFFGVRIYLNVRKIGVKLQLQPKLLLQVNAISSIENGKARRIPAEEIDCFYWEDNVESILSNTDHKKNENILDDGIGKNKPGRILMAKLKRKEHLILLYGQEEMTEEAEQELLSLLKTLYL